MYEPVTPAVLFVPRAKEDGREPAVLRTKNLSRIKSAPGCHRTRDLALTTLQANCAAQLYRLGRARISAVDNS